MTCLKNRKAKRRLASSLRSVQSNRCSICGEVFGLAATSLDHVLPRSRGGGNKGNLLLAHDACNKRKRNRLPTGCQLILLDYVNAEIAA